MLFSELARYFQQLEQTPSRNAMTGILSELFLNAHADEIGNICYLLLGRVAPLYEAVEFGIADKFMIRAIAIAYDVPIDAVTAEFKRVGDLGTVAEKMHIGKGEKLTVSEVFQIFCTITQMSGAGSQEKKIVCIADLLKQVESQSARYIARIPLDKLRLGFSDMTILDSLSWMVTGDKSLRNKLEDAYNVRPDIGLLAQTVKAHGASGLSHIHARVGAPILASLCQRLPTADEMIEKMGQVAVEPKYDGVRIQIHFKKSGFGKEGRARSFSRNLENTTEMFSELEDIAAELHADEVILDGEAIGVDPVSGKLSSFQETMTRKRKHDIVQTRKDMPLKFFIFDILYKDGKELLSTPLSQRRKILEQTIIPDKIFAISPQILTDSAEKIRGYHEAQISKGLEGVVVKKWDSNYEPGRRGFAWVKFKEEEGKTGKLTDTIDVVVMGYYAGEGKRSGFGIGAFLVGVRSRDEFVTLTKIGTGVSDELWKDLKSEFEKIKCATKPVAYAAVNKAFVPDVWVHPRLVVEIAGDDLTKSPTHGAGFAVRFPRLVHIRRDKGPAQSTSVAEIEKMFESQKSHHTKK